MIDIAHIHPMLVHFPLALLPVALAAQAIALARGDSLFGRTCTAQAGMALLTLAASGAVLAAVFGDMALDKALEGGVDLAKMEGHEGFGMLSAWLLAGLAGVEGWLYYRATSGRAPSIVALLAGVALLAVVLTTAWFGGHLVYDLGVNVGQGG